jgi:DNA-binding NarL/FixJ family response regulator
VDLLGNQEPRRSRRRPPIIVLIERRILVQSCLLRLLKRDLSGFQVWGLGSKSDLSRAVGQDVRLVAIAIESRPLTEPSVKLDVAAVAELFPDTSIVVISDGEDDTAAREALQWGVRGFFPSTIPIEVAIAGFRLVLAGGVYCPPPLLDRPRVGMHLPRMTHVRPGAASMQHGADADGAETLRSVALTPRESEVIAELQLGHSNKVIALNLGMSENTVKMHIQHLMRKLGARTRTEAVFRWAGGSVTARSVQRVGWS